MSVGHRSPRRCGRSRIRNLKALDYSGLVLDLSAASSDSLLPLKGAVGGALWIVNAVQVSRIRDPIPASAKLLTAHLTL